MTLVSISPTGIIKNSHDIKTITYKLKRFANENIYSDLSEDDQLYIIKFSILIMYKYFEKDTTIFDSVESAQTYFRISMIAAYWISYKFLADEDRLYAGDIKFISKRFSIEYKINKKDLLKKERELMKTINYNLFNLLKGFNPDKIIMF